MGIISSLVFEISRIIVHHIINEHIQKKQQICHLSFLMKILYFKLCALNDPELESHSWS